MQRIVIKTKSVEYMPFLLSFVMFLNAAAWTLYSVLTKDLFTGASNTLSIAEFNLAVKITHCYQDKQCNREIL